MDYTALQTGIILAPTAISVAIVSPFSGLISDRIGPRVPLFFGTVLMAYSLYLYKDLSLNSDYWFLFWPQVMRGAGLGLINAPLMSAAINAVRREQTSVASSLLTIIMQVGGAFGVAILGATLERRQYFHYAHYLQQINDAFSPAVYQAQLAMQQLLLKAGYSPAEVLLKGVPFRYWRSHCRGAAPSSQRCPIRRAAPPTSFRRACRCRRRTDGETLPNSIRSTTGASASRSYGG